MEFQLSRFSIKNLHGDTSVEITMDDNKLVIVADNGIGKTTIVNIIYYTLSKQWYKLVEYNFEAIKFTINKMSKEFSREDLNNFIKLRRLNRSLRKHYPQRITSSIEYILNNYNTNSLLKNSIELERIADKFNVPIQIIFDSLNDINLTNKNVEIDIIGEITEFLNREIECQILYLPTYRRIEKDLKNIFPELETDLDAFRSKRAAVEERNQYRYLELVEFGMDDVQEKLDAKLHFLYINFTNNIRQSLMGSYLRDVLNKNYEQTNYNFIKNITSEKITEILSRIDNSIMQINEKESLREFVEKYKTQPQLINNEDRIIAYFIQKLVDIYDIQSEAERDVNAFVEICNEYCYNKDFIYSREDRKIKVFLKDPLKEISLAKLSSGEKQIVSLFSHLYLSDKKSFFVIIDEPELSLSVTWQERLLPDILAAYNSGLIAVTHSPFIFSNETEKYTKGFNQFISIK